MPDTHIAESILALVTNRDRAACTVGDLLEQSATRGNAWFWSSVFRTAVSLLWRGMVDSAARITGLAFLGLVVDGAASALFAFLSGILFYTVIYNTGQPIPRDSVLLHIWLIAPTLLVSFLIGYLLSRWAPGRELPVASAYVLLVPAAMVLASLFFPAGLRSSGLASLFLTDLAKRLPAIAGAALARRRRELGTPATA